MRQSFFCLALQLSSQSAAARRCVNMSVCSLVIERINVKQDGKTLQRPARVIVASEDHISGEIIFSSKYIHYPRSDIIHNEYALNYNGIDATTLATHGEKFATVVDWVRAAIRCRIVVVCGMVGLEHFVEETTTCRVVDLQDFFITRNDAGIDEPVSLARLAKRFYDYDAKRDPFTDARLKIGLYYIMKSFKLTRAVTPPFAEDWFPKNVRNYKNDCITKRVTEVLLLDDAADTTDQMLCASCVKAAAPSPASTWEESTAAPMARFPTAESLTKTSEEHAYENDWEAPKGDGLRAERPRSLGRGKKAMTC